MFHYDIQGDLVEGFAQTATKQCTCPCKTKYGRKIYNCKCSCKVRYYINALKKRCPKASPPSNINILVPAPVSVYSPPAPNVVYSPPPAPAPSPFTPVVLQQNTPSPALYRQDDIIPIPMQIFSPAPAPAFF